MILKKKIKTQSRFFDFKQNRNSIYQIFKGWNNSIIIKFNLKKKDKISNSFFEENFKSIHNKEKIIVLTSGNIEISEENKKY